MTGYLTFLGFFVSFTPFVLMAGRNAKSEKRVMATRFNLVHSRLSTETESALQIDENLTTTRKGSVAVARRWLELASRAIHFRSLAARAGYKRSEATFLTLCASAQLITGGVVTLVTSYASVGLMCGFAAGYIPVIVLRVQGSRRLKAFERALPQVAEMTARALRAGHSLPAAFSIVAEQAPEPAREEFAELFQKQRFGLPLREALMEMLERVPSQDLRVLVVGILVQRETGGNLTVVLDRTSSVIRERVKLQGEVSVHTAQGRLTGWILCALPVILFVVLHIVNPSYTKDLTEDPFGRKCLYTAVGLLAIGALVMQKIINGIEV